MLVEGRFIEVGSGRVLWISRLPSLENGGVVCYALRL